MQQGLLDTERSLTQLHKVDVAPDSLEATRQEKPLGVCSTILSKDIEIYRKPKPIVSEWFNTGTEHYWHNHFVVEREDFTTISWYRAYGWAKSAWPLPTLTSLRGSGSSQAETDLELDATHTGPDIPYSKDLVKGTPRGSNDGMCSPQERYLVR